MIDRDGTHFSFIQHESKASSYCTQKGSVTVVEISFFFVLHLTRTPFRFLIKDAVDQEIGNWIGHDERVQNGEERPADGILNVKRVEDGEKIVRRPEAHVGDDDQRSLTFGHLKR